MIVVCIFAAGQGDLNRLVYGVDSYGFTCGSSTTFFGSTFDLSSRKNLYFLNPLDLLSVVNIPYAKSICVDTCPSVTCGLTTFPCTTAEAFRCGCVEASWGDRLNRSKQRLTSELTIHFSTLLLVTGVRTTRCSRRGPT